MNKKIDYEVRPTEDGKYAIWKIEGFKETRISVKNTEEAANKVLSQLISAATLRNFIR